MNLIAPLQPTTPPPPGPHSPPVQGTAQKLAPQPQHRSVYLAVLTWAFTLFSTLRAVAYLPTMWATRTSGDSSPHSLWTWCIWLGANSTRAAWMYEQNGQRLGRALVFKIGNRNLSSKSDFLRAPPMLVTHRQHIAALVMAMVSSPALAGLVTLNGALDDPANSALVASDLGAARFINDLDTANNVALHVLNVAVGGTVKVRSIGAATGGIDPYFSLFSGTSPGLANFVESNYFHALAVGGDFTQDLLLPAGDYIVAISVFLNQSYAENLSMGALADGFTALGGPEFFGNGNYAFEFTLPDDTPVSVPEPASGVLAVAALSAAALARRRRPITIPPSTFGVHE